MQFFDTAFVIVILGQSVTTKRILLGSYSLIWLYSLEESHVEARFNQLAVIIGL